MPKPKEQGPTDRLIVVEHSRHADRRAVGNSVFIARAIALRASVRDKESEPDHRGYHLAVVPKTGLTTASVSLYDNREGLHPLIDRPGPQEPRVTTGKASRLVVWESLRDGFAPDLSNPGHLSGLAETGNSVLLRHPDEIDPTLEGLAQQIDDPVAVATAMVIKAAAASFRQQ